MNIDVLFVSSRGSQYRYFQSLSRASSFVTRVVSHFPGIGFKVFNSGLTRSKIKTGVKFHLERKRRKYMNGMPNPLMFKMYSLFSYLYFSFIYLKFKHYLESNSIKCICIWNGHRLPEMAVKSAAESLGVKVAFFENGLLPNSTTMDFSGVNAISSIPRDSKFYLDAYLKLHADELNTDPERLVIREGHKKRRDLNFESFNFESNYIFVPFQVGYDSQVIINSPYVNSMEQFFQLLLEIVESISDKEVAFVIKEHPSDARSYPEYHSAHPRIKFVNENTEELILNSKAVITLNSSVGMEALTLKKKVIVLGNACFEMPGLTLKAHSAIDLISVIDSLGDWNLDEQLRLSYLYFLRQEYLLTGRWQEMQASITPGHLFAFELKIKKELKNEKTHF